MGVWRERFSPGRRCRDVFVALVVKFIMNDKGLDSTPRGLSVKDGARFVLIIVAVFKRLADKCYDVCLCGAILENVWEPSG